ncbi:hypothetical protein BCON_0554g00030 [Botryotinia convoluta]|uniref:Uncharacterized protein n=1 Tax=Botryotinia convoluta TaxID=54673 RepID=A0A4Z1H659_9HELO|nr:hypothetical protein BCON_0554g00030 [Botryotinia convoluta]
MTVCTGEGVETAVALPADVVVTAAEIPTQFTGRTNTRVPAVKGGEIEVSCIEDTLTGIPCHNFNKGITIRDSIC